MFVLMSYLDLAYKIMHSNFNGNTEINGFDTDLLEASGHAERTNRCAYRAVKLSSSLTGCEVSLFRAEHMRDWIKQRSLNFFLG